MHDDSNKTGQIIEPQGSVMQMWKISFWKYGDCGRTFFLRQRKVQALSLEPPFQAKHRKLDYVRRQQKKINCYPLKDNLYLG